MFTNDLSVRVEPTEILWDGLAEWPELARWIGDDIAPALRAGVPVLRDTAAVEQPPYVRPPGHVRAFYVQTPRTTLAIKGSEPFAANFTAILDMLAGARVTVDLRLGSPALDRTLSRAELDGLAKLAIVEGKVPGCVTVHEALEEARAALAVQRAYVARFGEPARLPLPILVGRWPAERVAMVTEALTSRMRDRALHAALGALAGGIAVYVYAYPGVPLRLAHLSVPDARTGSDVAGRLDALRRWIDPLAIVERWFELVARLLAIGFVPKDPSAVVTGDCLQVQNVCLDGGLTDVASLVASTQLDERALRDALRRTAHELALDATRLLFGVTTSTIEMRDRLPELVAYVWADLAARVAAHGPSDARIASVLRGTPDAPRAILRALELAL